MYEAGKEIIASSPEPFAEELAIHDYNGFPHDIVSELGEYPSFETVANVARALEEGGEAFGKWWSTQDSALELDGDELLSRFREEYRGEWDSEEAYAYNVIEELGWGGVERVPDELLPYLDMERIAVELFQHGSYTFDDGHVFETVY
jgi:antirestriction protein